MNYFEILSDKDIDEKIELNKKHWGYDLIQLKDKLDDELAQTKRLLFKLESEYLTHKVFRHRKFVEDTLPYRINIMNLEEQIAHITNKIWSQFNGGKLPKLD